MRKLFLCSAIALLGQLSVIAAPVTSRYGTKRICHIECFDEGEKYRDATNSLCPTRSDGYYATARPIKGGYLGKRFIICAEGSYNPNYSSWKDFLLSYNLQYGGNIHFVTGRFSEVGVSYNMYSMGAHDRYRGDLANSGKIKGYQVGFTFRKYREKRGGLAPIGKFIDYNVYYHSNTYTPASTGIAPYMGDPLELSGISASIGFGTQGIFWNRVVANAGLRLGGPVYTLSSTSGDSLNGDLPEYMKERLMYKDFFSVFFGVGVIL